MLRRPAAHDQQHRGGIGRAACKHDEDRAAGIRWGGAICWPQHWQALIRRALCVRLGVLQELSVCGPATPASRSTAVRSACSRQLNRHAVPGLHGLHAAGVRGDLVDIQCRCPRDPASGPQARRERRAHVPILPSAAVRGRGDRRHRQKIITSKWVVTHAQGTYRVRGRSGRRRTRDLGLRRRQRHGRLGEGVARRVRSAVACLGESGCGRRRERGRRSSRPRVTSRSRARS